MLEENGYLHIFITAEDKTIKIKRSVIEEVEAIKFGENSRNGIEM